MSVTLRLQVRYPVGDDTLVLRTAHDWERDLAPTTATRDGAGFDLAFDAPFLSLKACLRRNDALHWSVGDNYARSSCRHHTAAEHVPHRQGNGACRHAGGRRSAAGGRAD